MSKLLKDLKVRFKHTMEKVSSILQIEAGDLKRDDYVRISVDTGLDGRLNKEELNLLGGFKQAKGTYFEKSVGKPKVLIFDIETAPMLAYVWKLWDNNVALNQIKDDWYVLSWSAKWLGAPEDEVIYQDLRGSKNIEDDTKLLEGIWNLLDEADIVISQNGIRFDSKKLNARFILNGFEPPSTYRHIDTLRIAKSKFAFTSNKLAYMTDKLCTKYKKLSHAKFSGFSLWRECLAGNMEAWEEMEEYNRYDVLSLEELYNKLIPWDGSIDFNVYNDEVQTECKCGSTDFKRSGFHYSNTGKFQKYKCVDCGNETRDKTNLLSKEKRKSLRTKA